MQKITIACLLLITLFFASCKKEEVFEANATLKINEAVPYCRCCAALSYHIDNLENSVGNNIFFTNELPPGLSWPTTFPYEKRVHIKYKKDETMDCDDFITVTHIEFLGE